jgi:hypothetical protein
MSVQTSSAVKLAIGEALINLARIYPGFLPAILELIQNSINAKAKIIEVRIDRKARDVMVRDNGQGVTKQRMDRKLETLCISDKQVADGETYARHGIGFVVFTGKCKEYRFTTRIPGNINHAWQWTFNTKRIEKSVDNLDVPCESVPLDQLADERFTDETGGCWTTEMHVFGYTNNVQWSAVRPEDIKERVLESFSVLMRKYGTKIWVTGCDLAGKELPWLSFEASDYIGKPLNAFTVKGDHGGSATTIRLFLVSKKDKRTGVVSVGVDGDPFRLSLQRFLHSLGPKFVSTLHKELREPYEAMRDLLCSGRLEGEVINDKAVRMPSRDAFLVDDAAYELVEHLIAWFEERGREYVDETRGRELDEHRQNLGREALQNVNSVIQEVPGFREILKEFSFGKISDAHTQPGKAAGKDEQPSVNIQKNIAGGTEGRHEGDRVGKETAPRHVPYTSAGPQGKPRTLVKNDSQGIHLAYEDVPESQVLWRFDRDTGTLFINSNSQLWVRCEQRSDEDTKRLVEMVLIQAILLQSVPDSHRHVVRDYLRALEAPMVATLQGSSSFTSTRKELPQKRVLKK